MRRGGWRACARADAPRSARKLLNMRLFPNAETSRAWDRSVVDESAELLCVSQVRGRARKRTQRGRANGACSHARGTTDACLQFTLYCRLKGRLAGTPACFEVR